MQSLAPTARSKLQKAGACSRALGASRPVATMVTRDSQTFVLPDRRVLGYAEFGRPDGYPLLFFHGFPMSRLEGYGFDKVARRQNLRVVALDRPGFGLSTFQPGRRITDWPADVQSFAEHMQLTRFAILGGSRRRAVRAGLRTGAAP